MGDPDGSLQSDPAHELGGDEVSSAPPNLPDSLVFEPPVLAEPIQNLVQALPQVVVEWRPVLVVEVGGVQHGPVQVELGLLVSGIAEPYRTRALVAGEVREVGLLDFFAAVDAVEGLKQAIGALGVAAVAQPAHEVSRLLVKTDGDQGVEREGGVPKP